MAITITIGAAVIRQQFGSSEALAGVVLFLAVPLWRMCMVLIFQLNHTINSLPTAIVRVVISDQLPRVCTALLALGMEVNRQLVDRQSGSLLLKQAPPAPTHMLCEYF